MTRDEAVLALIPARGGSKGIPQKNLCRVGTLTLTARAVRCARETGRFGRVVVSTDSDAIAAEARAESAEVIRRPDTLASDTADVVDVISHTLDALARDGFTPGIVVLLEPTSPLRTPDMVADVLDRLGGADAAFTVSPVPVRFHPRKQFRMEPDGSARRVAPDLAMPVRRQELAETFVQNGAAYAFRTAMFRAHRSIFGPAPRAVVVTAPLVNIDTPEDLDEARRLVGAESAR
jgi:CMP-N-acetylneuraminic acid synthetase